MKGILQEWKKKRQIKAFNRAVKRFIKADEKEQELLLKDVIRLVEKEGLTSEERAERLRQTWKVFPEYEKETATIVFTEEETEGFSQPFKTLFNALERTARVTKAADGKDGYKYEIRFRRYGYNVSATGNDLKETKEKFIEKARRADEDDEGRK